MDSNKGISFVDNMERIFLSSCSSIDESPTSMTYNKVDYTISGISWSSPSDSKINLHYENHPVDPDSVQKKIISAEQNVTTTSHGDVPFLILSKANDNLHCGFGDFQITANNVNLEQQHGGQFQIDPSQIPAENKLEKQDSLTKTTNKISEGYLAVESGDSSPKESSAKNFAENVERKMIDENPDSIDSLVYTESFASVNSVNFACSNATTNNLVESCDGDSISPAEINDDVDGFEDDNESSDDEDELTENEILINRIMAKIPCLETIEKTTLVAQRCIIAGICVLGVLSVVENLSFY